MRHPIRLALVLSVLPALGGAATAGAAGKPSPATVEIYKAKCLSCHMADGAAPLDMMNLADDKWKHGSSPAAVAKVIAEGVPSSAMLAFKTQLTPAQIADLAAYVRSFDKTLKPAKARR
jgi:cytochrome c oxidase cbb3-type subunit 3